MSGKKSQEMIICGYFFESVLSDKSMDKYHGKYPEPPKGEIEYGAYNCSSYYHAKEEDDSTANDSIMPGNENDIMLEYNEDNEHLAVPNEGGAVSPAEKTPSSNSSETTGNKTGRKPQEEDIYL